MECPRRLTACAVGPDGKGGRGASRVLRRWAVPGVAAIYAAVFVTLTVALAPAPAYAVHPNNRLDCGGALQRACCTTEAFPSCDTGLLEIAGCQDASLCGGCSSGYCNHFAPTADDFTHCGGPGQRACCGNEVGALTRKCDEGATEVNGCVGDCSCGIGGSNANSTCIATPPCGGLGQRGCCTGELINGQRPCQEGFVEIFGCTGDCLCGGGAGGANPTQARPWGRASPRRPTSSSRPASRRRTGRHPPRPPGAR